MRIRSLKVSVPAMIASIVLSAGLTYAAIMATWDITSSVLVEAQYGVEVPNVVTLEQVTAFDFGAVLVGETVEATRVCVRNVGNVQAWIAWTVQNLPAGFTLSCRHIDSGNWVNQTSKFDYFGAVQPDDYWGDTGSLETFAFYLTNDNAAAGNYQSTIRILGADSSAG